jgi:hypothetical protein
VPIEQNAGCGQSKFYYLLCHGRVKEALRRMMRNSISKAIIFSLAGLMVTAFAVAAISASAAGLSGGLGGLGARPSGGFGGFHGAHRAAVREHSIVEASAAFMARPWASTRRQLRGVS